MSDRLTHLQRQKALLREHLDWIEDEIAGESGKSFPGPTVATPPLPSPVIPPGASPAAPSSAAAPAEADAIIERYASSERQNPADIRRGCFLVFTAALLLVAGVIGAVWLLFYNN